MATFFERMNEVVTNAGRKAQSAVEHARLMLEEQRVRGERDRHLREVGRLIHAEARGAAPDPAKRDELFVAIDKADAELARIAKELAATKGEVVSVKDEGAPAPDGGAASGPQD